MPCGNSTPPRTPWQSPPGFPATPEALGIPYLVPTQEDLPARFLARRQPSPFLLFPTHGSILLLMFQHNQRGRCWWRLCAPWCVFCIALLLLTCCCRQQPSGLPPPPPPAVLSSSPVAYSSVSSPSHLALLFPISSMSLPLAQYFPPSPFSLLHTGGSFVVCLLSPTARRHCRCCIRYLLLRPLRFARCYPYSPVYTPCPPTPTTAVPWDPASARTAPRASSPGLGHRYFP